MGRTANKPADALDLPPLDGKVLTDSQNLVSAHREGVMAAFGDGLVYDRTRLIHEARFYMAQSAEAMLEAGKRLIVLKENEPHGDFELIVREQLGIPERTARRMMQASFKYLSPELQGKAPALVALGKTKLFELISEDDEDLAALADGGTVAGLTLDDIDQMTSRELRDALREAREDAAAQRQVLAAKNEKIDELATKLEKKPLVKVLPPDAEAKQLRQEATAHSHAAEAAVRGSLWPVMQALLENAAKTGADPMPTMSGLVAQIERACQDLRTEFNIPLAAEADSTPAWMRPDADQQVLEALKQETGA